MTLSTVRAGVDTFVTSIPASTATKNYNGAARLRVGPQSNPQSLLRFNTPAPKGATILSAYLVLYQVEAEAGAVTVTARRLGNKWDASRVTWNSRPTAVANVAAGTLTRQAPGINSEWKIPVTSIVQAWTDGHPNYGFVLTADVDMRFHSLEAPNYRPRLVVEWATRPDRPTVLKPAFGIVGTSHPVLSCNYSDRDGSTSCSAVQVQIDADGEFVADVAWDSGQVNTSGVAELDLSTTTFPGLAEGDESWWRIRVLDGDGLWSQWSDPAPLVWAIKGVVTILSPGAPPNAFVSEFTPPILWSFSAPQTHYRITVARVDDPRRLLYNTGKINSAETEHTIPKGVLADDVAYRLTVQAWDDIGREATSGDPVYAEATRDFTVDYDATIDPHTSLVASQPPLPRGAHGPWVTLEWKRATAPDSWTVLRDGAAVATDLEPSDTAVETPEGVVYVYRDLGGRPEVPHRYHVKANVNGKLSAGGPSVVFTPTVVGIWLVDPHDPVNKRVVLGGKDFATEQEDVADTFTTMGSANVVRAVTGLSGLSGSVDNALLYSRFKDPDYTWLAMEKRLLEFKGRPADTFRMIWGDLNIPVVLGNVRIAPHPETIAGRVLKTVSFSFWQIGEHPFKVDF